jgi:uncharacterized cupin superfamily protein
MVRHMHDHALTFAKLAPSGSRFQRLQTELGVNGFGFNLINLQPGQRGRIHAHEKQEELYLVLEGDLTLSVDGEQYVLGKYDLVRVAPHVRRQLTNASQVPVIFLALGSDGAHTGKDGRAWESWEEEGPGRAPTDIPSPPDISVA